MARHNMAVLSPYIWQCHSEDSTVGPLCWSCDRKCDATNCSFM